MSADITYLELSDDRSTAHKFYEVTVEGNDLRIRYGRIGDRGQTQAKTYPSPEKAQAEAAKKIREKLKKGYEPAVPGVRQRRSITRRSTTSTASTVRQRSPLLWQFKSKSAAFGIFVDQDSCWMGNQGGQVFKLDHQGQVLNQYQLPEGVKCLVGDDRWIYAGCDDGNVYDLTGKLPRLAYTIDESVDILWLDIWDGLMGVSDASGGLTKINPEGEVDWTRLSSGTTGWMVRVDAQGFYHGHGAGVTLYDRDEGRQLWHQPTAGAVLFGWQEADRVYAGASNGSMPVRPTASSTPSPRRMDRNKTGPPVMLRCFPAPRTPAAPGCLRGMAPPPSTVLMSRDNGSGNWPRAAVPPCPCSSGPMGPGTIASTLSPVMGRWRRWM
ncbi:WGR domain-containing protein [Prochlorothrix hollandica]|uniref:WGR domain-containing protein n=1 Tax=Prochlorothrix hollandica TaxID=1223 RepID=UPI00333F2AE8